MEAVVPTTVPVASVVTLSFFFFSDNTTDIDMSELPLLVEAECSGDTGKAEPSSAAAKHGTGPSISPNVTSGVSQELIPKPSLTPTPYESNRHKIEYPDCSGSDVAGEIGNKDFINKCVDADCSSSDGGGTSNTIEKKRPSTAIASAQRIGMQEDLVIKKNKKIHWHHGKPGVYLKRIKRRHSSRYFRPSHPNFFA